MKKVILVHKPPSATPLEIIQTIQSRDPSLAGVPLAYAGRLDPMAEGLLLILVGDECKLRTTYERLEKEYEFDIILGLSTDTYDVMGLITESSIEHVEKISLHNWEKKIIDLTTQLTGTYDQPYPPYSSARVKGKPLFYWARQNKLDEITIPSKTVHIYSITMQHTRTITVEEMVSNSINRIKNTRGEFRQEEIIDSWNRCLQMHGNCSLPLFSFKVVCSSGAYVRSLTHEIGKTLCTGAVTYRINRTRIGTFSSEQIPDLDKT